jgi:hypothetical protein
MGWTVVPERVFSWTVSERESGLQFNMIGGIADKYSTWWCLTGALGWTVP